MYNMRAQGRFFSKEGNQSDNISFNNQEVALLRVPHMSSKEISSKDIQALFVNAKSETQLLSREALKALVRGLDSLLKTKHTLRAEISQPQQIANQRFKASR